MAIDSTGRAISLGVIGLGGRGQAQLGVLLKHQDDLVKMQNGDMDALLVNLALTRDATTGRPMNYRLVENGRIKPLQYRVIGKENMTVAGKPVLARKVAQSSGNKQTIVWIAPGIPTPPRIVQREDGFF